MEEKQVLSVPLAGSSQVLKVAMWKRNSEVEISDILQAGEVLKVAM